MTDGQLLALYIYIDTFNGMKNKQVIAIILQNLLV